MGNNGNSYLSTRFSIQCGLIASPGSLESFYPRVARIIFNIIFNPTPMVPRVCHDDVHDCFFVFVTDFFVFVTDTPVFVTDTPAFVTDTPVTPVITQLETSASASRYGRIQVRTDSVHLGTDGSRYGRIQLTFMYSSS
jgi:hypothetical protein